MSEPLTSHEIEDVLSSIRRLVSEELRPVSRANAAAKPAVAEGEGRLLLTPALRVVADREEPEAVPPGESAGFAEGDALAPAVSDYEEMEPADWGMPLSREAAEAEDVLPEAAAEVEAEDDEVLWASPGVHDAVLTEDIGAERPLAEAEPSRPGHWSGQDVPAMDWSQEESDWVDSDPMPFVAHPRKAALADDPLARAWADKAEADVRAELKEAVQPAPKPEAAKPAAPPAGGLFDDDPEGFDEEALRDIVRDIIRDELAGTLGERITRNVRKLVRIEINRALTAREFE